MTPGSSGLMGALLIVIGLAFALLAVAIVLNRRDVEVESQQSKGQDEPEQPAELEGEVSEGTEQLQAAADSEPAEGQPGVESDELRGAPEPMLQSEPEIVDTREVEIDQQVPPPPSPRELLPIAELLREEVSGELVLRLGDQYLRSSDEIQNDADRRKLQYASIDLATWFEGAELPARRRTGKREPAPSQDRAILAEADRPEGAGSPGRERGEAPRPVNMIEAINAILEKKLAATEDIPRAVRLVPDPTGGVRVLIGVKSYPLEEVPDEGIKQLIRQAVGEWEASQ